MRKWSEIGEMIGIEGIRIEGGIEVLALPGRIGGKRWVVLEP